MLPFLLLPEIAFTHARSLLVLLPTHTLSDDGFDVLPLRCLLLLLWQDLGVLSSRHGLAIPLEDRLEPRYEPTVNRLIVRHLNLAHAHLRRRHLLSTVLLITASFGVIVVFDLLLAQEGLMLTL